MKVAIAIVFTAIALVIYNPQLTIADDSADQTPAIVKEFSDNFKNDIKSWTCIDWLFNVNYTAKHAADTIKHIAYESGKQVGTPNPEQSSQLVHDAVYNTFPSMTVDKFANTYGFSVGNFLNNEGFLNENNVTQQAKAYSDATLQAFLDGPKRDNLHVVGNGFVNFLLQTGKFGVDFDKVVDAYNGGLYASSGVQPPTPPPPSSIDVYIIPQ